MYTENTFDIGKVNLHYHEGGTPDKPVLVLLHGLSGSCHAYDGEFEIYGPDWHIYALDLRGHGKSGKTETSYTIPDYAGDVIEFLRRHIGEPVVLAGHSTGALTTLAVAASAPDTVRAIIANDPPFLAPDLSIDDFPGPKMWFTWVYETVKDSPTFDQAHFERVLEACKDANPDAPENELRDMARQVAGVAPGTVLNALEDRHLDGIDLQAALARIECPTLLLYGDLESGSAVREQDAREFQRLVPQAVVHHIPEGSHVLWWEQAELVRGHVGDFLSSIGRA
jgi:pimeloyl-ACP methyl ester carboxylesterase